MRMRVGHTPDGQPVTVDTAALSVLLLVGDPGRGKTTTARHLARWWQAADPRRAVRVLAGRPHEYGDLDAHLLTDPRVPAAGDAATLTILDPADDLPAAVAHAHAAAPGLSVLTSYGPAARQCRITPCLCLGLLPEDEDGGGSWQGRLDWPAATIPTHLARRGLVDWPRHRWTAPVPVAS